MHRVRQLGITVLTIGLVVVGGTCALPTDRSAELKVELDSVPTLFLKDTVVLRARIVDAAGNPVPNAAVSYGSGDATVVSVDAATGRLLAVGVGTTTVTATAPGFASAAQASRTARVRGLIEIDSVVPRLTLFGDTIHVFGVGLNPDSLFAIQLGGTDVRSAGYLPADAAHPNRLGRLSLWVMPPAERFSLLTVIGIGGGVAFPDTLAVAQRDIYEPNDTVPWYLGDVASPLDNPALAFEVRGRSDVAQPADWYTFTNPTTQDRTVIVSSEAGPLTFSVFMTDSLWWSSAKKDFQVGPRSWTIGPQAYLCNGLSVTRLGQPVTFAEQLFPVSIMALGGLPTGKYHVLVPYVPPAQPRAYELRILPSYVSTLPPDAAEENDYCDVAQPLSKAVGTLTIDNPHDIDWFEFPVNTLPKFASFTVTAAGAISPNLPTPDLDLYLVQDFRPDSLVLVASGTSPGTQESVGATLVPGDYFLIVVDYPGSPTEYTMNAAFTAPPALGAPFDDGFEALRRKAAASATPPVPLKRPRPRSPRDR